MRARTVLILALGLGAAVAIATLARNPGTTAEPRAASDDLAHPETARVHRAPPVLAVGNTASAEAPATGVPAAEPALPVYTTDDPAHATTTGDLDMDPLELRLAEQAWQPPRDPEADADALPDDEPPDPEMDAAEREEHAIERATIAPGGPDLVMD